MTLENLLFWTLCIGSALIALSMAAQGAALLYLYSQTKMFRRSAAQLKVGSLQVKSAVQQIAKQSRSEIGHTAHDVKILAASVENLTDRLQGSWYCLLDGVQHIQDRAEVHARRIARRKT